MKVATFICVVVLGISGCSTSSVPLAQRTPVHLCYDLITVNETDAVNIYQELQRRGENCDKYHQQVALMIQAEAQRRAAVSAAMTNMGAKAKSNQQSIEDAYWAPQRAMQQNAPIKCTSQQGLGGTVNTTCR